MSKNAVSSLFAVAVIIYYMQHAPSFSPAKYHFVSLNRTIHGTKASFTYTRRAYITRWLACGPILSALVRRQRLRLFADKINVTADAEANRRKRLKQTQGLHTHTLPRRARRTTAREVFYGCMASF